MNLWMLSLHEVLQVFCKTVPGVGIQVGMIFWGLSRCGAPRVFYRTPFPEVYRASKNLWTFSPHEVPQVFYRTTPFHEVFEASMNLWTLSPCEVLQVSCTTLAEEVSRIDKYFLALFRRGEPEGHCMGPPGEVSELDKDPWRLSEVPQVFCKTPFTFKVSARAGEGFLTLLRHKDPVESQRTSFADEVSQAAGTEFQMFLHLEVLEARHRSTIAAEGDQGTAIAFEEHQGVATEERQGIVAAEEGQGTTIAVASEEDLGTAIAVASEEDQGTAIATEEEDQGTALATEEEDQGTVALATEEGQGTIALAVASHTQQVS